MRSVRYEDNDRAALVIRRVDEDICIEVLQYDSMGQLQTAILFELDTSDIRLMIEDLKDAVRMTEQSITSNPY
jgi:hypothetical protein